MLAVHQDDGSDQTLHLPQFYELPVDAVDPDLQVVVEYHAVEGIGADIGAVHFPG